MSGLPRSFSLLVCLALIFSALPIPAQTQIQHGVPWQNASGQSGFAPAGAHLSYFGGPVVSNAQIVQVLYGSGSYNPQVAGSSGPTMGNFFGDILGTNSGYINLLSQYSTNISGGTNQIIGNGTFDGIFQITPSAGNNGSTIDDSNIQAELLAQINAGHLPAPVLDAAGNVNTIYMIYFPPGKTITEGGHTSCVAGGFCAYHGTTSNTLNSKHLLYGVMPDMQAGSGCSTGCGASGVFGNYTSVTSHELSETITDADVGLEPNLPPVAPIAWYDSNNGEIGDICNGQQGSYVANGTTYTIQLEFSNAANNCVLPPPAPQTTAPINNVVASFTADQTSGSIFYVGVNGHIGQIWNNGHWGTNDLSSLTGAPNAGTSSPVFANLSTPCCNSSVFYLGSDQHVHQIWYNGNWGHNDLGTLTGAPNAVVGSQLGGAFTASGSNGAVFYFGVDGHLHQLWYNGNWGHNDLGALTGAANASAGSPLAVTFTADQTSGSIYYVGVNGHVTQIWYNGHWGENDLNALTGAPSAGSASPVIANLSTPCCNGSVFYLGSDQHVHQLWYNGNWGHNDLGTLTGAPNAVVGSQLGGTFTASGSNGAVFYFGVDGHLHQLSYNGNWGHNDLGALTGAANASVGSPMVVSFTADQTSGSIFYVGVNGHVTQVWNNGHWGENDLGALTGAANDAAGSPLSGSFLANETQGGLLC